MVKRSERSNHFSHLFFDAEKIAEIWVVGEFRLNIDLEHDRDEVMIDVIMIRPIHSKNWIDCTNSVFENDEYSTRLVAKIIDWHDEGVLCFIDKQSIS